MQTENGCEIEPFAPKRAPSTTDSRRATSKSSSRSARVQGLCSTVPRSRTILALTHCSPRRSPHSTKSKLSSRRKSARGVRSKAMTWLRNRHPMKATDHRHKPTQQRNAATSSTKSTSRSPPKPTKYEKPMTSNSQPSPATPLTNPAAPARGRRISRASRQRSDPCGSCAIGFKS